MATVKIQIDSTQKILLKRHLNQSGQAQIKFTQECAKQMNNYIPLDTGRLKDMTVEMTESSVIYNAPYAAKQYYTNSGNGKQGNANGGLRGKLWDRRMWPDKSDSIVKTIADFVGGKVK